MTDEGPTGSGVTERTARTYLEDRVRELEAENAAMTARADHLVDRIDQLGRLMASMSRVARIVGATRTSIRRPSALVRLPGEIVRLARAPMALPAIDSAPAVGRAEAARERQALAALRAHDRLVGAAGRRDASSLRVALVADVAVAAGLAPECELIPVRPHSWRRVLEASRPDLLLVQSAWRGTGGTWQYRIGLYPHPDAYRLSHLRALVDWCRAAGVPTVFWSTEDPLHADRFASASQLFDHVFSVDPGSVARLAELPERSAARVAHLPMAVQPRLHNPTGRAAAPRTVAFIGAFYRGRSLAERDDLELLLDAGARAGLVIYDRKSGADEKLFAFPERLRGRIAGWLPTSGVPDAIRVHRAILATPDPGAIPARVFEALACGRPVVTTSRSAAATAFEQSVRSGSTAAEIDAILAGLVGEDPGVDPAVDAAISRIMRGDTYRQRLATIARAVGYDVTVAPELPALIARVDDDGEAERLAEVVAGLAGEIQEVVVGTTDGDGVGRACRERLAGIDPAVPLRIVHQNAEDSASRVRRLAAVAGSSWVHVCDAGRRDPVRSLGPLIAAIVYADADVIGSPLDRGVSYATAAAVDPLAAVVRRSVMLDHEWHVGPATARAAMTRWSADGIRIYAAAALPDGARR